MSRKLIIEKLLSNGEIINNNEFQSMMSSLLAINQNNSEITEYPNNLKLTEYQYLLDNKLITSNEIFDIANNLDSEDLLQDQLIDLSLANKVKFITLKTSLIKLSDINIEKCLNHGLEYHLLVKSMLMELRSPNDDVSDIKLSLSEKDKKILTTALKNNATINSVFEEIIEEDSYIKINGEDKKVFLSLEILRILVIDYNLDPNLILQYAVIKGMIPVAKLSIDLGAKVNDCFYSGNIPIVAMSIMTKYLMEKKIPNIFSKNTNLSSYNITSESSLVEIRNSLKNIDNDLSKAIDKATAFLDMFDFLIENGAKVEITPIMYRLFISVLDFNSIIKIFESSDTICSAREIYDLYRANGESEVNTENFIDIYNFIYEYMEMKSGKATSFGEMEIKLLNNLVNIDSIEEYKEFKFTNKYGYGPLHLSIITGQYELAIKMINAGFDIYAKSFKSITPIQLIEDFGGENKSLLDAIVNALDGVDIDLGRGESLVDSLFEVEDMFEAIIEKTKDPLFSLLKKDADLDFASKNKNKTYIAISEEDGNWSTGVWSASRLIAKKYPNVEFHLVNTDIVKKGGESFLKQYDGFINPGAGDSFPKTPEFTKDDCSFSMPLELHYQHILEFSSKNNIPYLGMCAGAQHFALYNNAILNAVKGYNMGQHQVTYIKGSLAYFQALTKTQQNNLLDSCEFPDISFKGDTAHHYAADSNNLGNNINLGALSEDNIAMSYCSVNGISCATQYHPEHQYDNLGEENAINQIVWLDNYVELAIMHHDFKVNNAPHPIQYMANVELRINECLVGDSFTTEL